MPVEVQQRPVRPDDAEALAAFHHRCWTVGYVGLVDQAVLDVLREEDRLALWVDLLATDVHPTTVLTVDDQPVAFVRVEPPVITGVYVDPDWWGRGLGHRLVREGERLLREAGVEHAELWTLVGNDRAVGLYESEGWARDGTVEGHDHPFGFVLHEQRLRKRL